MRAILGVPEPREGFLSVAEAESAAKVVDFEL